MLCKKCNYNEIPQKRRHCDDCKKRAKKDKIKRRKVEFLDYLSKHQCVDCGINDIRVLEFDHLRDKNYNISDFFGKKPLHVLMEEIKKCEIVCANCHRIRTAKRGNWYNY